MIRWLWLEFWPVWLTAILVGMHYCAYVLAPDKILVINKIAGSTLQVIGGLIVLYSTYKNIRLFEQKNLLARFTGCFKRCPLLKRPVTRNFMVSLSNESSCSDISVIMQFNIVEEKIAELERQMQEYRQIMIDKEKKFNEKIVVSETSLIEKITKTDKQIDKVETQFHKLVVGGISTQVFGVLLIVYGAVVGFI
ncbi:hypothetical protein [Desulfobacula sp.]|uniref:hypothetical protein n=1 Tax=Desulfobacula sp. TaxID=2593537 RepID=UPI0027148AD4|nr:hypothetical protein [Desulfobacula sp.]